MNPPYNLRSRINDNTIETTCVNLPNTILLAPQRQQLFRPMLVHNYQVIFLNSYSI